LGGLGHKFSGSKKLLENADFSYFAEKCPESPRNGAEPHPNGAKPTLEVEIPDIGAPRPRTGFCAKILVLGQNPWFWGPVGAKIRAPASFWPELFSRVAISGLKKG